MKNSAMERNELLIHTTWMNLKMYFGMQEKADSKDSNYTIPPLTWHSGEKAELQERKM